VTHGYTSQDWFQDRDIINASLEPLEKIIPATKGITAIVGTIRPNTETTGGDFLIRRRSFTTASFWALPDKTLLPEYDVFDDPRYFEPSPVRKMFNVAGRKIGVVVCEDFWNDKTFWKEAAYSVDPAGRIDYAGRGNHRRHQRFAV
jgi:predicted amidohydrolase